MITNFIFATLLVGLTIGLIVSIDTTTSLTSKLIRRILRWTQNSKRLTEYVLRAYVRYRRSINKPLINKAY